ncbi:MAG TPA: CvpA family protein [Pyrinomonadaceae bacterium]|nr:CvpA family protein [Pyrinomonadaceae bacterium]
MTVFDFFVLAVVAASVAAGAMRGLVRALLVGAALIVGLLAAAHGYEWAGGVLRGLGLFARDETARAGGFLLIVGGAVAAGFALGHFARAGLRRARVGWFDGGLGAAFGLLRGLAFCSVVYLALTAFPVRIAAVAEARTAPALAAGARVLSLCTSAEVREKFLTEYRRAAARR